MSDLYTSMANSVVGGLTAQLRANGFNGTATAIGVGVGSLLSHVDTLKSDYQRGDYGALAADSFVAGGAISAAAAVTLLGGAGILAVGLEGVAATMAYIAIAAAAGAANHYVNEALQQDAAKIALALNKEAKALKEASSDAIDVILDDIRSQIADLLQLR